MIERRKVLKMLGVGLTAPVAAVKVIAALPECPSYRDPFYKTTGMGFTFDPCRLRECFGGPRCPHILIPGKMNLFT